MFKKLTALAALVLCICMLTPAASAMSMSYYSPGDPVDDFTLELTDGTEFTLSENLGKIVVLDLWATWCPNCIYYSMPALTTIMENYPDEVAVVAVNCGDLRDDVIAFAEQAGYEFPVAIDEQLDVLYNRFPTSGIPYTVFIDAQGNFYTAHLGAGEDVVETYIETIDEMLAAQEMQ